MVSKNKETLLGCVSFKGDYACHKLRARKTWQFLFDYYLSRGGDVKRMGDMLIDYVSLEKFFEEYPEDGSTTKFYWALFADRLTAFFSYSPDHSGYDWWLRGEWSWGNQLVEFTLFEEVPDGSDD